jgi:hypothetical protein
VSKESTYLRDAKAVALAIGLKLYDPSKRKMLADQMEAVRLIMQVREGVTFREFPKSVKTKGGTMWPRAEVVAWAEANLKLSKDKRTFDLKPAAEKAESGKRKPEGANAEPITELEVQAKIRHFPPDYQKRLLGLYSKWLNPTDGKSLTRDEKKELIQAGIIQEAFQGKAGPVDVPDYCSQSEFARLASELYNVPVYPMQVSRAINEEGMPGRMSNQSIKTSLALPWWEQNKVRKEIGDQGNLFSRTAAAELEIKEANARRARMEADEVERATSNKWVLAEVHERTLTAAGIEARNTARDAFERNLPKVFASGLDAVLQNLKPETGNLKDALLAKLRTDCVSVFNAWQAQTVAAVENMIQQTKPQNEMKP